MTSRDALLQSLNDLLCYSVKRDKPDAAEKLLSAMEAYFRRKTQPPVFGTHNGQYVVGVDWGHGVSGSVSTVYCLKDPDVAELLDAIDAFFLYFLYDPFITSEQANRVRDGYERVKAKYD